MSELKKKMGKMALGLLSVEAERSSKKMCRFAMYEPPVPKKLKKNK